ANACTAKCPSSAPMEMTSMFDSLRRSLIDISTSTGSTTSFVESRIAASSTTSALVMRIGARSSRSAHSIASSSADKIATNTEVSTNIRNDPTYGQSRLWSSHGHQQPPLLLNDQRYPSDVWSRGPVHFQFSVVPRGHR